MELTLSLLMTHRALSKSRRDTWSWSRRSLLAFTEFTSPNKLPLIYQISILRRLLVSICWRKSRLEGHSNRQHLSEFSTLASKPKTLSEVTYKDQNNTAHTSGANHKAPSMLVTKIRTTHSSHIWCKPITPFEVTYKDEKNIVHTSIYRL